MKYLKKLNEVVGNYDEFISEQLLLESLLLESNIVYSPRMRMALQKIKTDPIADGLLGIENKDIETPSNYFDIMMDKNDTVTFTPDKKAKEILGNTEELVTYIGKKGGFLTHNMVENAELFKDLGYEPDGEKPYKPENSKEIGKIISKAVSKITGKVFCYVEFKGGKGVFNQTVLAPVGEDKTKLVWTKNRQEIKIGRIARILLMNANQGKDVPVRDVELFVNSFKAVVDVLNDKFALFERVSGEEIGYWYHNRNYLKCQSSLGSSCQAPGRLDWLEIYTKNPDTVNLLISKAENDPTKITGRALLWRLDEPTGGIYMDYVYSMSEAIGNLFNEYAKENGWITFNDRRGQLFTHIKPIKYAGWPSIDTMRNWDPKTGKVSSAHFTDSVGMTWGPNNKPSGYYNPLDNGPMSYEEYYKKLFPHAVEEPAVEPEVPKLTPEKDEKIKRGPGRPRKIKEEEKE